MAQSLQPGAHSTDEVDDIDPNHGQYSRDGEPDEEEKHDHDIKVLQIALIKCKCGECNLKDDELYICCRCTYPVDIFCEECGIFYHTNKKSTKDHPFEISSSNVRSMKHIITEPADSVEYNSGKQLIVQLIGIEKYNKIAQYVDYTANVTVSSFPVATQLAVKLTDFFDAATNALEAHSAGQELMKLAHKVNVVASIAGKNIAASKAGAVQHLNEGYGTAMARHYAETTGLQAAASLETATQISDVVKPAALTCGVATCVEMAFHGYNWSTGDMETSEWVRLFGKALCRNAASSAGTMVGGKLGAYAGCALAAKTGVSKLGATAGIVIGLVGGLTAGWFAAKMYEDYYPQNEKTARVDEVVKALLYFGFQQSDIDNPKVFNEDSLNQMFKQRALKDHPDRRDGDHSAWYVLSAYYGILEGVLEQNEKNRKTVQKSLK